MKIDQRLFTEARSEDFEDPDGFPFEDPDQIRFFRSEMDGEWYVEMGHKTSGGCSYVSGTFKVNDDVGLDYLHEESEEVTVFGIRKWDE
jgi:hypothetical protein